MVGLGCQAVTLELHKQKEQTETARGKLGTTCSATTATNSRHLHFNAENFCTCT